MILIFSLLHFIFVQICVSFLVAGIQIIPIVIADENIIFLGGDLSGGVVI